MLNQRAFLFIASLGVAVAAPCFASASDDRALAELRTRISELESEVRTLRTNDRDWLTEERAREVRSLVQDVLADADTRASFLAQDTDFKIKVSGQIQARYIYNFQDEDSADSNRAGFEMRRTKLTFEGNIVDPTWAYHVTGGFARGGGAFTLEDAYIEKTFDNGLKFRFGQFKLPFMIEETISSKRQQAVDRSLVNEEYNQDRSQGIQLSMSGDQFRWWVAFSDGFTTSNSAALDYDTEWAFTARGEFLAAGKWSQFADFSSWKGEDFGMLIGAAVHTERGEYGTGVGPELETFTWTIDASLEFGGANIFAAVVGRHLEDDGGLDADQYGIVLQGGVFLTDDFEIFARYEWSDFDASGVEDLSVITVGFNKYWSKHNLKWTTDIGYGINEVHPVFSATGVGWRADPGDEDGQVVIRTQLQLNF